MMAAHRVPRSTFMFTLVTLLVVVSWTATTLSLAAPTCSLKPRAENTTTPGVITSNSGGGNATISKSAGRAGLDQEDVIATSWFPGWLSDSFPPSSIPWAKYNMMTYAFALTTEDPSKLDLNGEEAVLKTFVTQAHRNGVKALLSVGGWTGSQHFSTAVATDAGRTTFTKAITGIATQYGLDGIDFDWEYPNADGIGCNTKSPEDAENFLTFLKQLRDDPIGSRLIVTAAAGVKPFAGPDATPLADVSAFSEVLDFIAIMNYDVFGSWSTTTGPNAPLDDACASEGSRFGSAESAVEAWTGAQFPAEQLLLGLASYGHSFFVDNTAAKTADGTLDVYSVFDKAKQPFGQGEDATNTAVADKCGNQGVPSGVFYFNGLIEGGFLGVDGNPADGIDYTFDACSQTPFVYQQSSQTLVSFDDAKSFAAKGAFINSKGLKGFAVWHVAGDSKDNILLSSVHDAMGIATECPNDDGDAAPPTEGDAGDSGDGSGGDAGEIDEDGTGGADGSDGGEVNGGGEGDNSDGGDDSTGDDQGGGGGAGDGGAGDNSDGGDQGGGAGEGGGEGDSTDGGDGSYGGDQGGGEDGSGGGDGSGGYDTGDYKP